MTDFADLVEETARAAVANEPEIQELLPRLVDAANEQPVPVLAAALPRLGAAVAASMPNLGCHLAVVAGAWMERGADPGGAELPIFTRAVEVADACVRFVGAWERGDGGALPDPVDDRPSEEILDRVGPLLDDPVDAMLSWFSLEMFGLASITMLCKSPALRAGVPDRDRAIALFGTLEDHCGLLSWLPQLLRVLEGERLLVLDRATRRGWTVTIGGVGDNFQLHMLLADVLLGRPDGMPGEPVPAAVAEAFRDGEADDLHTDSPWNLVDAHGDWIWNEGVPADIPVVDGARVVVVDPPPYQRTFRAERTFPLMAGHATVEAAHAPQELERWWSVVRPDARPR